AAVLSGDARDEGLLLQRSSLPRQAKSLNLNWAGRGGKKAGKGKGTVSLASPGSLGAPRPAARPCVPGIARRGSLQTPPPIPEGLEDPPSLLGFSVPCPSL